MNSNALCLLTKARTLYADARSDATLHTRYSAALSALTCLWQAGYVGGEIVRLKREFELRRYDPYWVPQKESLCDLLRRTARALESTDGCDE